MLFICITFLSLRACEIIVLAMWRSNFHNISTFGWKEDEKNYTYSGKQRSLKAPLLLQAQANTKRLQQFDPQQNATSHQPNPANHFLCLFPKSKKQMQKSIYTYYPIGSHSQHLILQEFRFLDPLVFGRYPPRASAPHLAERTHCR